MSHIKVHKLHANGRMSRPTFAVGAFELGGVTFKTEENAKAGEVRSVAVRLFANSTRDENGASHFITISRDIIMEAHKRIVEAEARRTADLPI